MSNHGDLQLQQLYKQAQAALLFSGCRSQGVVNCLNDNSSLIQKAPKLIGLFGEYPEIARCLAGHQTFFIRLLGSMERTFNNFSSINALFDEISYPSDIYAWREEFLNTCTALPVRIRENRRFMELFLTIPNYFAEIFYVPSHLEDNDILFANLIQVVQGHIDVSFWGTLSPWPGQSYSDILLKNRVPQLFSTLSAFSVERQYNGNA